VTARGGTGAAGSALPVMATISVVVEVAPLSSAMV